MAAGLDTEEARATAVEIDGRLDVALSGSWRITAARPSWAELLGDRKPQRIRVTVDEVEKWDTSLLLFLFEVQEWCRVEGLYCDTEALPEKIRTLLSQFVTAHETSVPFDRSDSFFTGVGRRTIDTWKRGRNASTFVGESVIGMARLLKHPLKFRW